MAEFKKDFAQFVEKWNAKIAAIEERYDNCTTCEELDHLKDKANAFEQFSKELIAASEHYFTAIDDLYDELSKISGSSSEDSSRVQSPVSDQSDQLKKANFTLRCMIAEQLDEEKQAKDSLTEIGKYMDWLSHQNKQLYERVKCGVSSYACSADGRPKHLVTTNKPSRHDSTHGENGRVEEKSLTDSEADDKETVRQVMDGCRALTTVLNEKYEQLREQKQYIARLRHELEIARTDRQSENMTNTIAQLTADKTELQMKISEQKLLIDAFNEKQKHWKQNETKLLEMETTRVDQLQQIRMHSERIEVLLNDNQLLADSNGKMLTSIRKCKLELKQYNQMSRTL